VERKHKHLIETDRAIRLHANLPLKFWGSCVLDATHIVNKLPTAVLYWASPYEKLYGKPPDYSELRVLGCLCYSLDTSSRDKFEKKARRCIFLGYPAHQKAYSL